MTRTRTIIVVAYGAPDLLGEALIPLISESVLVVDCSQSEQTRELVEGLGYRYLDPGGNLGFAGGVNFGLRHLAEGRQQGDVLLLNPDAQIQRPAIDALQAALLDDRTLAAVAPLLVTPDGEPHLSWYALPSPKSLWKLATLLPRARFAGDFLIGAVLLIRAEALADVGEFDERYFLYGEEADWQRRAFDRGWRVDQVSSATAVHHGGSSSDNAEVRTVLVTAGQETYVRRWHGAGGWVSYRIAGWLWSSLRSIRRRDRRDDRLRARSFRLGPRRVAPLPPPPRPLRVVHLAYRVPMVAAVLEVAAAQARAGHTITVIVGETRPAMGGKIGWCRGSTVGELVRGLRDLSPVDVVHAYGFTPALVACATGAWHGARVVVSPNRGTFAPLITQAGANLLGRRIDIVMPTRDALNVAAYRASTAASTLRKTNIA